MEERCGRNGSSRRAARRRHQSAARWWSRSFRETGRTGSQYRHSRLKDRRRIFGRAPTRRLDQHIRLDLALYPGFSGGPLLNARGEVVGINTRGLAHGRAVTVPVATVNRVVEELLEKGHVARPYLGIAMQPVEVPDNMRSKLPGQTRVGLLVVQVENDGPAEKAGMLLGDFLFEVGGET